MKIALASIVLLFSAAVSVSAQRVLPKVGFCPSGYSSSSGYCVPRKNARDAFVKTGRFCPSGYHSTGDYCLANR